MATGNAPKSPFITKDGKIAREWLAWLERATASSTSHDLAPVMLLMGG